MIILVAKVELIWLVTEASDVLRWHSVTQMHSSQKPPAEESGLSIRIADKMPSKPVV